MEIKRLLKRDFGEGLRKKLVYGGVAGVLLFGGYGRSCGDEPVRSAQEPAYVEFRFKDEVEDILKHAKRIGVEPELIMAIRSQENGRDEIAYGVLPKGKQKERYDNDKGYNLEGKFCEYKDEKEKQLCWAAWTIKRNKERFAANPNGHSDFIDYLASVYAPINADNDPDRQNKYWEGNVRKLYQDFKD